MKWLIQSLDRTDLAHFSWRWVMVLPEVRSQLPARIDKNGTQTSACGAGFPGLELSIPLFRADF